jgi:hypothetical protein
MKAAGHELKAIMEYMDCRVRGLHFPLIVLVDYRGYRLIAEPLLPVGEDTIVYGSADGGRAIHARSRKMNEMMKLAARILNLRGHTIWSWSRTSQTKLYAPVDIEGHQGRDGRFYLLDTARVFPPASPLNG